MVEIRKMIRDGASSLDLFVYLKREEEAIFRKKHVIPKL